MANVPDRPAGGAVTRILKDTAGYAPSALLPALFSLIGSAVFTRLFPPSQYGVYTLLGAVTGPALSLLSQPAAQAVNRFLAEYEHRGDTAAYRQAVSWLFFATVVGVATLSALALLLWPHVGRSSVTELALAGALVGLLASTVSNILTPALMAAIKVRVYRRSTIATQGLALALPLLLVTVAGRRIAWLLWGNALAVLAVLPYLITRTRILVRPRRLTPAERETLRRFWAYGAPMTLWFFSSSLLNLGDRWVIQLYHGTEQVGLYGANYALAAQGAALLTTPLLNATGPRLLREWAVGRQAAVRATMRRMTGIYGVVGFALIGGLAVVGHPLVAVLLGRAFRPGADVLVPVLAGVVVWGASRIGHKSMEFVEANRLMVLDVLVAAAVNMGLNFWWVPRYGYVAAGYTTLIAYLVYTVLVWWQSRFRVPWDIPAADLGAALVAAGLAWAAAALLLLPHFGSPIARFFLGGASFLFVYGAILALYWHWRGNPPWQDTASA